MKTVLILRHAKSSWSHASLPDHDRPLNGRGERDAPRMGELILDRGLVPDQIVSSTALRARTTAAVVAEICGYPGEIVLDDALYLSDLPTYKSTLRRMPDQVQRILVVGHNPDMEALITALTGHYRRMPTAALAQITIAIDCWSELAFHGEHDLTNLWLPRELST